MNLLLLIKVTETLFSRILGSCYTKHPGAACVPLIACVPSPVLESQVEHLASIWFLDGPGYV